MPSMFSSSSRHRGSSTSRTRSMDQSTSSSAAAAASAAAYIHRNASNTSLSAAAAAAALRSHTTSPEPVGSIQTKRMVRRGSQSSIGSGSVISTTFRGNASRGNLTRRPSNGSMTDRTFRSPSPGSRNSYRPQSPDVNAHPVPPIPTNAAGTHRRTASVESPRQRLTSPTPGPRGRGVSVDRAGSMTTSRQPPRLSDVAEEMLDRGDSQRKVNFSRPRAASPTGSAAGSVAGAAPSGQTALDQKIARIHAAQIQNGRPRQNGTAQSSQGAHLTKANLEAVSAAAAKAPPPVEYETVMVFDPSTRTFQPQQRVKGTAEPPSPTAIHAPKLPPGSYDPSTRTIVPGAPATTKSREQPAARPRVQAAPQSNMLPPPRNPARLSPSNSPRNSYIEPSEPVAQPAATAPTKRVSKPPVTVATPTHKRSSSLDVPRGGSQQNAGRVRNVSASPSPQRSAHFSASPVVKATLHNPPARDFSPAKSAMKHSPAPSDRPASPLFNYKGPASETSEAPSAASSEGMKKKKSVRVSFDEQPAVAPIVSATTTPSRPALDDIDDEDFSKPRPALPNFGSVRKGRQAPAFAEKVTEMAPARQETSSDRALAGIVSQANGNAKPSQYGHIDEQHSGSEYSVDDSAPTHSQDGPKTITRDFAAAAPADVGTSQDANGDVPGIALLPPTPGVEDEEKHLAGHDETAEQPRRSEEVIVPGHWDAEEESPVHEEPSPIIARPRSPALDPINEYTDSDDDAQFSDAHEDQSEWEEGGYASLNAIAVSPVAVATQRFKAASPPTSPTKRQARQKDSIDLTDNKPTEDWSEATAYWSTLSRQQREEIERQHFSSDDESTPVVRKPKKKVTTQPVDKTPSSRQAAPVQKSVPSPNAQPAKPALKKTMRATPEPAPVEKPIQLRTSMRAGGGGGMASSLRDGPRRQSSNSKPALQNNNTSRPTSQNGPPAASTRPLSSRQESRNSVMSTGSTTSLTSMRPHPAPVMTAKMRQQINNDSDSESSFKKSRRSRSSLDAGRATMRTSMRGAPVRQEPRREERRAASPDPVRKKGRDSFSIRSLSPTGSLFGRKKLKDQIRGQSVDTGVRTSLRGPPPEPKRSSMRATPAPAPASKASKFRSRFGDSDDSDDGAPRRSGGHFRSRFADSDDEDDDVFASSELAPVRGIPRTKGRNDGDSTELSEEEDVPFPEREKFNTPLVPDPSDIDKAMEAARKKLGIPAATSAAPSAAQEGKALKSGSLRGNAKTKPSVDLGNRAEPKSRVEDVADTTPKKRGFMGSILRRSRNSTQSVSTLSGYRPSTEIPPPTPNPLAETNGKKASSRPKTPTSPSANALPASPGSPSHPKFEFETDGPPTPSVDARPATSPSPAGGRMKLMRRTSSQSQAPTSTPSSPAFAPRMKRGDSTLSTATAPPDTRNDGRVGADWPLPPVPKIPDGYGGDANGDGRPGTSDGQGVRFAEGTVYSQRTGKKKRFGLLRRAFGLND